MKKLMSVIVLLLLFGIVSMSVLLVLMPERVPAHYNGDGQVDRVGSKYEYLIFPGFALLMAGVMLALLRYEKGKGMPESEQRILLYVTAFSVILFDGLGLLFGLLALNQNSDGSSLEPDVIVKMVCVATGALLMILGNIMPKARRNAIFGLRTKWSMSSENAWRRSQRFAGFGAVICGLLMVIQAVILPGDWNILVMTGLMLIWVTAGIFASRYYARAGA